MNMDIAGHQAIGHLRRLINQEETHPQRRARLFVKFGSPRAAVMQRLTDAILLFVTEEAHALNESWVLDYGCGVMPYKKAFDLVGAKVLGIDIGKNNEAQIQISDKAGLPIADNSLDYAISVQVLEHLAVPHQYLMEINRVLKDGGKVFLTTHGTWPYHPTPRDFHRWTKSGLCNDLVAAGFSIISTTTILNEYSSAVQSFVMTGDYRGVWKWTRGCVHFFAHIIIELLEYSVHAESDIPAVICVLAEKL